MKKSPALRLLFFILFLSLILLTLPRQNALVASDGSATFVTSWGSDVTSNGNLKMPQGIAVDSSGNIFVADTRNHRIQKFTSTGTFVLTWGTLGSAEGQFNLPTDVGVDSLGNVYVADSGNNRIQKFTTLGTFVTAWGTLGSVVGQFITPSALAVKRCLPRA